MRIVFAGTPEFVLPTLKALAASKHQLAAVYAAPDRRAGRGLRKRPNPVKQYAVKNGLAVEQVSVFDQEACQRLASYRAEVIVVMACGRIFPPAALRAASVACVNVHLSLLPRWRGASPAARAVEAGDQRSGVCLIKMTDRLDAGPVISAREVTLAPDETAASLTQKLSRIAPALVTGFLDDPEAMLAAAAEQPQAGVCYAPRLQKSEAWIDWSKPASVLERKVRAFIPWPVAHTLLDGCVLRIWSARSCSGSGAPGRVLKAGSSGVVIACGEGALSLVTVQPQNGNRMSAVDFANGHPVAGRCLRSNNGRMG